MAVADQIEPLISWNEVVRIDLAFRRLVAGLSVVDGVNRLMLQYGLNNRLEKIRTFLPVSGCAHLNNAGNILDNAILPRLLLKMCCHDFIVCRLESGWQLIFVNDGRKQREHQRFLFGEIERIHKKLAHKPVASASSFVRNRSDKIEDFQISVYRTDVCIAFESKVSGGNAGIRLNRVDDVENADDFVDHGNSPHNHSTDL
jgi:hypothetical protein